MMLLKKWSRIKEKLNLFPFLKQIILTFLIFNFLSFLFYCFNYTLIDELTAYDLIIIAWFNIITISLIYLPYCFFYLIPLQGKLKNISHLISKIIYCSITFIALFLIVFNIAFYSFTLKHLSFDYILYTLNNQEDKNLLLKFIYEYYLLAITFIIAVSFLIYVNITTPIKNYKNIGQGLFKFILTLLVFFILGRGGFQLKPIGILDATNYTNSNKAPFVLNSTFTVLKTIHLRGVKEKNYLSLNEEKVLFNPIYKHQSQNILPDSTNVVIIILESYGKVYTGINNKESYTPFFDSIYDQSLHFKNSIANGKTSLDALPSILASFPSWMNETYILSSYIGNKLNGLPYYLNKIGYESLFFHGANNGSMRFDAFSKKIGFQKYYGRSEYNNDHHYDGLWGIPDHYFLPFVAKKLHNKKSPFLASIFTISSHHPFTIPKSFENKVINGPEKICASLNYTDLALKEFWKSIKKEKWFENTLFVFCADHTGPTIRKDKSSLNLKYQIPIAFYHPKIKIPKPQHQHSIQQLDILPSILDLINYDKKSYCYGMSIFNQTKNIKLVHSQGNFMVFNDQHKIWEWNETKTNQSSAKIKLLKAVIQRYNRDLIQNKTHIE